MHWKAKAAAFRALEWPGGAAVHYFLQRHVTRTWPRAKGTLDALWNIAGRVLEDCTNHATPALPTSVLEVGAGRDLAVPLALNRRGVTRVVASDVTRLARLDLVRHAAHHMAQKSAIPFPGRLATWGDLEQIGIYYRAPETIGASYPEAFDCSCSNEVLEHVPEPALRRLIAGLKAATRPGGISTHSIDYSDHYARSDRNVTRFNFLTYSDAQWARYNGGLQHLNRLRHSDYLRIFREAGFTIAHDSTRIAEPEASVRANLAPQFRSYDENDLFALQGRIIAVG
jgi:2-polyprenyl-3-methyl-5-hydroxy-6-metoxy-1,4-benzoquinol methylase